MYDHQMKPAFTGMKADSGFDRVDTYPAAEDMIFGIVVGEKAGGGKVGKGKQVKAVGVSVHDHLGGIKANSAVSVMTQGVIWVKVAAGKTITKGPVKYDANGELDGTQSEVLPNSVVKKVVGELAMIELNYPAI